MTIDLDLMKSLLVSCLFVLTSFMHPIKMSFSKMSFNNGIAKVQTRLFLDDLTYHIQEKYRLIKADFSTIDSNGSQALQLYIDQNFYLIQEEKHIPLKIIEISTSEDNIALVVTLEATKKLQDNRPLKINNTLLFDIFKKQENVLRIYHTENNYQVFSFTINSPVH